MGTERLALDTRRWLPRSNETAAAAKRRAVVDFASALNEQREGNLENRTNFFTLYIKEGKLFHPDFGFLQDYLRNETRIDGLENEAFYRIQDWANLGDPKTLIWISPPSEEVGHTESRFVIFEIGKAQILCRAICSDFNEKDCLRAAEQLVAFSPLNLLLIETSDNLRRIPIPFEPPRGQSWVDFLEEAMGPSLVWRNIRAGKDVRAKGKNLAMAESIVGKHYSEIASAKGNYEHLVVGRRLELEAKSQGISFQSVGSCGISNSEALRGFGVFNILFFFADFKSEKSWDYHAGQCRVCGLDLPVGPCNICKNCEKKFEFGL